MEQLDLSQYNYLEHIIVGENSFMNVKQVNITDNVNLKTVTIGKNSFTNHRNSFGMENDKSFSVSNCSSLHSITVGQYAFSDFLSFSIESTLRI